MKNGILLAMALVVTALISVGLASGDKSVSPSPSPSVTPHFLETGKVYGFEISYTTCLDDSSNNKFIRGKVIEQPRDGWVRIEPVREDKHFLPASWINLNRVNVVIPLETVK